MATFQYDPDVQGAYENVIHTFENTGTNGIAGTVSVALFADSAFSDWVENGKSIEGFAESYKAQIEAYSDYTLALILRQDKTLKSDDGSWAGSGMCISEVTDLGDRKAYDNALCANTNGAYWNLSTLDYDSL